LVSVENGNFSITFTTTDGPNPPEKYPDTLDDCPVLP
jgi:hypothetical protein